MNRTKKHIDALNSNDDATRWEAVRTLKAIDIAHWTAASNSEVQALVETLCEQLPRRSETSGARLPTHLRRDVAFILGKLGDRAADSVPSLVELLRDDEPEGIREAAATALGDLREVGRPAIPALLAVLTPNCRVPLAVRVACALGEIGGADARVRSALSDLWRSTISRPITQIQISMALCKLKVDAPGLLASLTAGAVAGPNASHRVSACQSLAWCCKTQVGVLPALTAACYDDDETVAAAAKAALEQLGVSLPKAIQACVKQLKDCPHSVTALRRTGILGVNGLIKALEDEEPAVRESAAKILSSIGEPATQAAPALLKTLRDRCSEVRLSAAKALWNITKNPEAVVPALANLLTAKISPPAADGEVRRRFLQSVIEALGRMGPAAQDAVPSLLEVSEDDNRLVRESAVRTLHQIAPVAAAKAGV
jgi:HEAT repeat protein